MTSRFLTTLTKFPPLPYKISSSPKTYKISSLLRGTFLAAALLCCNAFWNPAVHGCIIFRFKSSSAVFLDLLAHTIKMRPVPTLYEHFFRPRHDRQFRYIYDYIRIYGLPRTTPPGPLTHLGQPPLVPSPTPDNPPWSPHSPRTTPLGPLTPLGKPPLVPSLA